MEKIAGLIILGCWIIFFAYWLVSAFGQKAIAERQSLLSALAHRIPLGFSYLLLAFRRLPPPMNLQLIPDADWALMMGVLICVLGLFVTLWARRTLAGNWSSDVTFKQGHELVRTGPYRFVRQPPVQERVGHVAVALSNQFAHGCSEASVARDQAERGGNSVGRGLRQSQPFRATLPPGNRPGPKRLPPAMVTTD